MIIKFRLKFEKSASSKPKLFQNCTGVRETILEILLLKQPLIILLELKWVSFLSYCTHNLTVCRIYIVFLPFFSLSLHFQLILSYIPPLFPWTLFYIRSLFLPSCVICLSSISLLPDTPWLSSFHFHDNPETPLDCKITFTAFIFFCLPPSLIIFFFSLAFFYSISPTGLSFFPPGFIGLFVIKNHFQSSFFFPLFRKIIKCLKLTKFSSFFFFFVHVFC